MSPFNFYGLHDVSFSWPETGCSGLEPLRFAASFALVADMASVWKACSIVGRCLLALRFSLEKGRAKVAHAPRS